MRIIVTGGAGFIGSHIADAYAEAGHDVTILDDLSSGKLENLPAGTRFERVDVRSEEAARVIKEVRPEVISHHAAQMNVRVSVDDPRLDADINVLGFLNVLEAAHAAGTKRVLFASSGGTVYGEPEQLPCPESYPTHPVCPYGVSKLAGEHYLYYYAAVRGMRYVALRYANVYGPRQDPHGEAGVIAIFAQRLLRDEPVTIFGDGKQTRDYVFVRDVVRANVACLDAEFTGGVNIGTGQETDVVELFERINALVGRSGAAQHAAARDGEVRRSALRVSLAESVLGWKPSVSLDDGLAATIDFFRSRS